MMERLIIKSIVLLIAIGTLSSCYSENELELYGEPACDTTAVSYATDVLPIINASCSTSGCHTAGGSANGIFDTHAGVLAKVQNGSFEERVINQRNMPPNGFLSDCDIQILQQWLADGAPNN